MTHDKIKAVAEGLTAAQRTALTSDGCALRSMGPKGYDTFIISVAYGRSAKVLHKAGLATLPFAPQILTPLGLAVRAYLQQETQP